MSSKPGRRKTESRNVKKKVTPEHQENGEKEIQSGLKTSIPLTPAVSFCLCVHQQRKREREGKHVTFSCQGT